MKKVIILASALRMKEKVILSSCLMLITVVSIAQGNSVRFGLRSGIYYSRFNFSNLPSEYRKPDGDETFYAGVQIDIPVSKKISIVPEVLYAISRVSSYIDGLGIYDDNLSHILIPVSFKYKIGKLGLSAGPQAEVLLSAKGYYRSSTLQYDPISNVYYATLEHGDIKNDSYRKLGFSGVLGAEYVFKYRFGIDARYQFGLTDFRASNGSTLMTQYGKIQMHAFQAGLFFRFGKKPPKNG